MNKLTTSIALVLCLLGSANGFELLVDGYSLETYVQYSSATSSGRITFDDGGNLYVVDYNGGNITKVNTNQQASTLVSGVGLLRDITWGGGTAFGNYLYVSSRTSDLLNDRIMKIDLNGTASYFAPMTPPRHGVTFVGIDRTGNYGGKMFSSASGQDRLYSIDTNGTVSLFADWPGWTDGGGPRGIGFDVSGNYAGKMYIANAFEEADSNISGLFAVNPDGSTSRFCNDIVQAYSLAIDGYGSYFDGDMFVMGRDTFGETSTLWRIFSDGTCEEFMAGVGSFTFGNDGAMYVSSYSYSADEVTIARVVPEPATLLLVSLGALCLRKRKHTF